MVTIILIYFLIGWIVGFAFTIYYSFDSATDELALIQSILYWPWLLVLAIHHFSKPIIKKLKNRSKSL